MRLVIKSGDRRRHDRAHFRHCGHRAEMPRWKGVSRTIRTSLRRSFSATSAARTNKFPVIPFAMADKECMEHGATTMPSIGKLPLAKGDPMSSKG